jgi:hypothetical protein
MYDETIQRSARRAGIRPILFEHPQRENVLSCFAPGAAPVSVILTGTAGDGKTHLCRQVWDMLGGDKREWESNNPHINTSTKGEGGRNTTIHFIRDLSAWVPQRNAQWDPEKALLLQRFCQSLFDPAVEELFLIAANDGQLIETWRRLPEDENVKRARSALETLLVEDRQSIDGTRLRFFNLSRGSSAELLDLALEAFINHEGWGECYASAGGAEDFFGPNCPVLHNFEVLKTPLFKKRLRALFELCDYNQLHIPIRQILLLLSNAVLGHSNANKDRLLLPADVPKVISAKTIARASIYNNVFGGNLPESRREALTIFDYLDRFRIGHETSNRIDNILIYGEADDNFREYFDTLLASDRFYGADEGFRNAQRDYVESTDEDDAKNVAFLEQLINQRRGLFFKIPEQWEVELSLWELTVFKYAGEYLSKVIEVLKVGGRVERPILSRLVKGLNRVFVGMLVNSDRELYLATSLSSTDARVSRILTERISVAPRLGEKVEITMAGGSHVPTLTVALSDRIQRSLELHLTRYEFLSRVAEGALPGSFSRECNEDMLAFKSQLLSALAERQQGVGAGEALTFKLLNLDDNGFPVEEVVEIANV